MNYYFPFEFCFQPLQILTPYDNYKRLNNMKSLIKESVQRLKVMASYWKTKKAILLKL